MIACANCEVSFKTGIKFSWVCPNTENTTVAEALSTVIPEKCHHWKSTPAELRILCRQCAGTLGSAYNSVIKFTSKHTPSETDEIHMGSIPDEKTPLRPMPSKKSRKKPSTPLSQKLRKIKSNKKQRRIYLTFLRMTIQNEMKSFLQATTMSKQIKSIHDLPSPVITEKELEVYAPTVREIIFAISGCSKKKPLNLKAFAAFSVLANSLSQRCDRFQKFSAFTLLQCGATDEAFRTFQKFGLVVSKKTVMRTVDELRMDYAKKIIDWKKNTEVLALEYEKRQQCSNVSSGIVSVENGLIRRPAKKKLKFEFSEEDFVTFSLVGDNVNVVENPRGYSSNSGPKQHDMMSIIGVENRIPLPFQQSFADPIFKNFADADASITYFEPTKSEYKMIQNEHRVIIKRCLIQQMEMFNGLKLTADELHIPHPYINQSSKKSDTVNLGILLENENTTDGMIRILENLEQYCPILPNGTKFEMTAWGDGLTTHRMQAAQVHRASSLAPDELLQCLVPGIGQWHRRVLVFGDHMRSLFKDPMLTVSPGTLPSFRTMFGHEKAGLNLKTKFNETFVFNRFVWTSYVVALACKNLKISDPTTIPDEYATMSQDDLMALLNTTCDSILSFEWHNLQMSSFRTQYCICRQGAESHTRNGRWFRCHNVECEIEWFNTDCSKRFNGVEGKAIADEDDIDMADEEDVSAFQFTLPKTSKNGKREWFCSNKCKKMREDRKLMYSKAVIFCGLLNEGLRDAIRENDGLRMLAHTKINLIQYLHRRHWIYSKITTNMLYNILCHKSGSIRHDLVWNSTVNLVGGMGKNLEIDLFNEMVIKRLKSFVFRNHGQLNDELILRMSQAMGILQDIREEAKDVLCCDSKYTGGSKDKQKWKVDITKAVDIILKNELLQHKGMRCHYGFANFNMDYLYINDITIYRDKLHSIVKNIELVNECAYE